MVGNIQSEESHYDAIEPSGASPFRPKDPYIFVLFEQQRLSYLSITIQELFTAIFLLKYTRISLPPRSIPLIRTLFFPPSKIRCLTQVNPLPIA